MSNAQNVALGNPYNASMLLHGKYDNVLQTHYFKILEHFFSFHILFVRHRNCSMLYGYNLTSVVDKKWSILMACNEPNYANFWH